MQHDMIYNKSNVSPFDFLETLIIDSYKTLYIRDTIFLISQVQTKINNAKSLLGPARRPVKIFQSRT